MSVTGDMSVALFVFIIVCDKIVTKALLSSRLGSKGQKVKMFNYLGGKENGRNRNGLDRRF